MLRKQLVKMKAMFKANDVLESYFLDAAMQQTLGALCSTSNAALSGDIEGVEATIYKLIDSDDTLRRQYAVMTTIPYIGRVIATELLIATEGFSQFASARKFASYCGIAPFPQTSGTSLHGKPRISQIGNKEMKALLHLAAMGSVRHKGSGLYAYYQRKVAAGKPKMSVLNAVRNKLVHYVFACVRNNCPFERAASAARNP